MIALPPDVWIMTSDGQPPCLCLDHRSAQPLRLASITSALRRTISSYRFRALSSLMMLNFAFSIVSAC